MPPSKTPAAKAIALPANDSAGDVNVSPLSKELVVGLVGYAGAGCTTAAKRLHIILHEAGYTVHRIKMSELIRSFWHKEAIPDLEDGPGEGASKLARATRLQDLGDQLRSVSGGHALSSLAIGKILELRGVLAAGENKIAYIIESLKHRDEVDLLRRVYDQSFRLLAVHCDRPTRESRLIGDQLSSAKYAGVSSSAVRDFMDRDEKDSTYNLGQQVRDAFYLADYFIDNNTHSANGANITSDAKRFAHLVLGTGLIRPTSDERAMYHAHAAALQSSCLSRQVGAALVSSDGRILSTGTNDVPRFGGGVYSEGDKPDHRCHAWVWDPQNQKFTGCHNDRRKEGLRHDIGAWIAATFSEKLAELAHPIPPAGADIAKAAREGAAERIRAHLTSDDKLYSALPGVKDLIEFSRAIHAEMDALISAARSGVSPVGSTLFCTTYPCHSCARHLVTAGVSKVFYIEPYVKSLASELHSDAIDNVKQPAKQSTGLAQQKMMVTPFTGVGPRMYEDFFAKRGELKGTGGVYVPPASSIPGLAVRLRELSSVEKSAAEMVPSS
jgi:deoxycytidylate deaminase